MTPLKVLKRGIHMTNNIHFNGNRRKKYYRVFVLGFIFLFTLLSQAKIASAKTYILAVQPILSKERTIKFYQPLAAFLSKATGHEIKIYSTSNFVAYWEELRQNKKYDLVLDAAHFADYRVKNLEYTILAKINDTLSFSLIANEDETYFDPEELTSKRISTVGSPSIAGIRLFHMFPNPIRQPAIIGTNNFPETLKKLKSKAVDAALVPTALISGDSSVNTITVTDPIPHLAISASNRVDKITKNKIRTALISANNSAEGQKLLGILNIAGFEKASNKTYAGYESLLKDVWGYK